MWGEGYKINFLRVDIVVLLRTTFVWWNTYTLTLMPDNHLIVNVFPVTFEISFETLIILYLFNSVIASKLVQNIHLHSVKWVILKHLCFSLTVI